MILLSGEPGEFDKALRLSVERAAKWRHCLKIPRIEGAMLKHPSRHFHFTPEVFLQTGGCTVFNCPAGKFRLMPGEIAVMPAGIPHGEKGQTWRGPFRNFVIMHSPDSLSWHSAAVARSGVPFGSKAHLHRTLTSARLAGYLNDLVDAFHGNALHRDGVVRGLLLAYLSGVRNVLAGEKSAGHGYSIKVAQARHTVMSRLADPALNVRYVADRLKCSADYLSNLFRRETGQTLISFIQRQRTAQARNLLESSTLSVKEVAAAIGYNDPGYFIRVFKRTAGLTPAFHQRLSRRGPMLTDPLPDTRSRPHTDAGHA